MDIAHGRSESRVAKVFETALRVLPFGLGLEMIGIVNCGGHALDKDSVDLRNARSVVPK